MEPVADEIVVRLPGRWLLGLLALAGLLWLLGHEERVVAVLFLATLLAVGIAPPVAALARRGVPRSVAIGLIYLVLVLVVGGAVALLVPLVTQEATLLATEGPALAGQITDTLRQTLPSGLSDRLVSALDLQSLAGQGLSQVGQLLSGATTLLLTLGQTLVLAIVVLAMAYFMVADERLLATLLARFVPPAHRASAEVLGGRLATQLGRWVRAQGLISLYYGVTFGVALALLGVPYALTLGVVGALLELVPYAGGAVATIIAMLVAFTVHPLTALWVLSAHLVIANVEAHILTPKLLGSRLGLHPLAVVIALFLGAEFLGILGALLAVPLLVIGQVLLDHFYRVGPEVNTAPVSPAPPPAGDDSRRPVLSGASAPSDASLPPSG